MRGTAPLAAALAAALVTALALAGWLIGLEATVAASAEATSISIRVEPGTVAPGGAATVRGHLRVPGASAAGREVGLEAKATGETDFVQVGTTTAGPNGGVVVSVRPEVTTRYRWRYAGAEDAIERVSGTVIVTVRTTGQPGRRVPTAIAIRAVRPAVAPGAATAVRGRLHAGQLTLRGKWIVLLSKSAGADTWQFRNARRTDRAGRVNFLIRPRTHTSYRLNFSGTQVHRPARSGVVEVRVRPTVTVAVDPTQVDPGASITVTGAIAGPEGPVGEATVDLMAREVRRGATWAVVASTTSAADGAVRLLAAPEQTSRYRLWVRASLATPSARSRTVTVEVRSPSSLSIRGKSAAEGFVVSGRLMAEGQAVRGEEVVLRSYDAATSTWPVVATAVTGRHGWVRFVQQPVPGASYRLGYDGPRFMSSTSATLTP